MAAREIIELLFKRHPTMELTSECGSRSLDRHFSSQRWTLHSLRTCQSERHCKTWCIFSSFVKSLFRRRHDSRQCLLILVQISLDLMWRARTRVVIAILSLCASNKFISVEVAPPCWGRSASMMTATTTTAVWLPKCGSAFNCAA